MPAGSLAKDRDAISLMIEHRTGATDRRKDGAQTPEVELTSFTQNIAAFEVIIGKMEIEAWSLSPNLDRLLIYQSEVQSLLGEIQSQQERAVQARGNDDANVQRLQKIISGRLRNVVIKIDELLRSSQGALVVLNNRMEAIDPAAGELADILTSNKDSGARADDEMEFDPAVAIANAAKQVQEVINSHPESNAYLEPVLENLLRLSLRALVDRRERGGIPPPRPPVDTQSPRGDDDGMESRIANLEKFAEEARKELRSVDVRLSKLETVADGIARNMATRADVAELRGTASKDIGDLKTAVAKDFGDLKASISHIESTLLKWFIGTVLTMTSLGFAAAKLLH